MRNATVLLPVSIFWACAGPPTENRLPPPTASVSASTRTLRDSSGRAGLEVSALVSNATQTRIGVAILPACPLFVQVFPDPSGAPIGVGGERPCKLDAGALQLAPGDTVVLKRVLGADTLATFAAGVYGVNVAVTTTTGLIGVWAGAVSLPLDSTH